MTDRLGTEPNWGVRIVAPVLGFFHFLFIPYTLLAWLIPNAAWLIIHLVAVPIIVIQWHFNDGICMLNNLESWLRTGRWRDTTDPDQGAWIAGLVERVLGWRPSPRWFDGLIYGLLVVSWLLSGVHLVRISG